MSWSAAALHAIDALSQARVLRGHFTIEEMRAEISIEDPHDLRAWGGVTQMAIKAKIIEPTGEFKGARSSHQSPKPVYRFVPVGFRSK